MRRRYGWLLVLSQSLVFWAFLGTLLAVMVVMRRRRGRWRMARLRATELPDDPAFWLDPRRRQAGSWRPWQGSEPTAGQPVNGAGSRRRDIGSLRFSRKNGILGLAGLLVIVLGYVLLAQGSITAAPLLLVLGYLVLLPLALVL